MSAVQQPAATPAPPPPAPGSPEYDAAMAAKFDAAQANAGGAPVAPPPAAPVRPDNVPEKFWDAAKGQVNTEALLKSYVELEKAKAGAPAATPPAAAPVTPPVEGQAPAPDATAAAAKAAVGPEAFEAYTAEFAEKGALSEESYKALGEKHGIPKELVDSFIQGQLAIQESTLNQGYALAGGKDQYAQMIQWAGTNLTPAEVEAFDAAVLGTPAQMAQAIMGLKARYEATYGQPQNLVTAEPNKGTLGYQSQAEMTADMKDPRYKTDAAFRRSVEQKLAVTTAF